MIPRHQIKDKIVEIDLEDFKKFVKYVKNLKSSLKKCSKVNQYLNSQIREYNSKFTNNDQEDK